MNEKGRASDKPQFLAYMIEAYTLLYPGIVIESAVCMAMQVYEEFVDEHLIQFGNDRYDWTRIGAFELVREMESNA